MIYYLKIEAEELREMNMKKMLFTIAVAAALPASRAFAGEALYASEYAGDGPIVLGKNMGYDMLCMNHDLVMPGDFSLSIYNESEILFESFPDTVFSITTGEGPYFNGAGSVYCFTISGFDLSAIPADSGMEKTLISSDGMVFRDCSPEQTTIKLNRAGYGEALDIGGIPYTYVGPKPDEYVFMSGEIGFTGYYEGSRALKLVVVGAIPEPATGALSLLALAALAARRRRK